MATKASSEGKSPPPSELSQAQIERSQSSTSISSNGLSPRGHAPEYGAQNSLRERWQVARQLQKEDRVIEIQAAGFNKGGLILDWKELPGFVPASQLIDFPSLHLEEERLQHLQQRQHQTLRLKIIEVDEQATRLIFSERATQVAAEERKRLIDDLQPGEQRCGVITNLAAFGAFVDLGGVEGLIHISQLSWRRLLHPADVVRPGEEIAVLVLSVDKKDGRVALSRKQLFDDPWPDLEERYRDGQIVQSVISNLVSYGAFALVEQELEGLIHVSELREGGCNHPADVVHKGDTVRARVLSASSQERRLALSLRGVT